MPLTAITSLFLGSHKAWQMSIYLRRSFHKDLVFVYLKFKCHRLTTKNILCSLISTQMLKRSMSSNRLDSFSSIPPSSDLFIHLYTLYFIQKYFMKLNIDCGILYSSTNIFHISPSRDVKVDSILISIFKQ